MPAHNNIRMTDKPSERVTLYMPKHRGKLLAQAVAAGMSPSAYVCWLLEKEESIQLIHYPNRAR